LTELLTKTTKKKGEENIRGRSPFFPQQKKGKGGGAFFKLLTAPPDHHTTPGERGGGDGLPLPRRQLAGRRRNPPTPPRHNHRDPKRSEKERGGSSKKEKGKGAVWQRQRWSTARVFGGLESGDRYKPRKLRVRGLGFRTLGVRNRWDSRHRRWGLILAARHDSGDH